MTNRVRRLHTLFRDNLLEMVMFLKEWLVCAGKILKNNLLLGTTLLTLAASMVLFSGCRSKILPKKEDKKNATKKEKNKKITMLPGGNNAG